MFSDIGPSIKTRTYIYESTPALSDLPKILPTAYKVIVEKENAISTETDGVYKIVTLVDGLQEERYTAAAAGATSIVRAAASLLTNPNALYNVGATGIAVGTTSIAITSTGLPNLVGTAIEINYSAADPLAINLPRILYPYASTATTVNIGLPAWGSVPAASVAAASINIINTAAYRRNIPCYFSVLTKTGASAKLLGSFPINCVGSVIVINGSEEKILTKAALNKKQAYTFEIVNYDSSDGSITIKDEEGILKTMGQGTSAELISAEIDEIVDFSSNIDPRVKNYWIKNEATVNFASFSPDVGDTFVITQHLKGL